MNKIKAMAAVLKFINGSNRESRYMQDVCDYITDPVKTDNGALVATHGCSKANPINDILANKKLWQKTHGKQGEHFVLALAPIGAGKSPVDVLNAINEIVATVYSQYMAVVAVHTDSKFIHGHVLLDAVNAVTGRKFSQSPSDLNRVKQQANNILKKHSFEIITASANEFVDHTDYSKEEGFDFLELDETELISEADAKIIEPYIDILGEDDFESDDWDYHSPYEISCNNDCNYFRYNNIYNGGFNEMNSKNYLPIAQKAKETTPTVETVPTTTSRAVPAACGTVNNYHNTNVATGPIFRIKGNQNSNFEGLKSLVKETVADAYEHLHDNSMLALKMQQYGQQTGHPSNVSVIGSPIFEIDTTAPAGSEYDDDDDYIEGDYGAYK